MASKYGRSSGSSFSLKGEKEKFFFIVAAGASLAAVMMVVLVTSLRSSGGAGVPVQPAADVGMDASNGAAALGNTYSVSLLAPEIEIPAGTKLSEIRFKTVFWPKSQVPEGAFTNVDELQALWAKEKLPAGVPIQRRMTSTKEVIPDIGTLDVTPGNRAVSFDVDDTSSVEGHTLAGSHVDVVLTKAEGGTLKTNVIVQNARVLSYGGDSSPGSAVLKEHRPVRVSRTITLDVSPDDALGITTAKQMGKLNLILRAPGDNASMPSTSTNSNEVGGNGSAGKGTTNDRACNKGRIKISGKEYIMGCDGAMSPID